MDWIRVDAALPTHRKSIDLAEITGEDLAFARIIRLWCWARANAQDGRIAGRNPVRLVEAAVGWAGPEGAFVAAAVEVGFLHREGDDLLIHDWAEHNGKALRRSEESAERARRWRDHKEAGRARQRDAEMSAKAAVTARESPEAGPGSRSRTPPERSPNAFGTHSRTHSERVPNAVQTDKQTNRRDITTTAGPPAPLPQPSPPLREAPKAFALEPQPFAESPVRRLSAAQTAREELRAMRAAALPGVVEDVELRSGALVATLGRIEQEATAKGSTVADAYAAFLRDDYARGCDPPCPIGLFVDGNKFRECLSAALRARGKGPPLALTAGRRAGGYVSLTEIESQDFTIDPAELADPESP